MTNTPTNAEIRRLRSSIKYLVSDRLDPYEFNDAQQIFAKWATHGGITTLLDRLEATEKGSSDISHLTANYKVQLEAKLKAYIPVENLIYLIRSTRDNKNASEELEMYIDDLLELFDAESGDLKT